jgi:hypothetical protein
MKKLIIGLLLCPSYLMSVQEKWLEHTYRNELDNPVKIITQYTQVTQGFVQPRKRRKVLSKKIACSVAHTLEPHETKTVTLKGEPLSARRLMPGSIKAFDTCEHDHAIVPKHNVHDRTTFVVCRNKKDKLKMKAQW